MATTVYVSNVTSAMTPRENYLGKGFCQFAQQPVLLRLLSGVATSDYLILIIRVLFMVLDGERETISPHVLFGILIGSILNVVH